MRAKDYQHIMGKSKSYVIDEIGTEVSYFHSEIWFYHLKTNWIGKKIYLVIFFKHEVVSRVKIKKSFATIRY